MFLFKTLFFFFFYKKFLQDEPGTQLDPDDGGEEEKFNGVSTGESHGAGPRKKRHKIQAQERDKDQQVSKECGFFWSMNHWIQNIREYTP